MRGCCNWGRRGTRSQTEHRRGHRGGPAKIRHIIAGNRVQLVHRQWRAARIADQNPDPLCPCPVQKRQHRDDKVGVIKQIADKDQIDRWQVARKHIPWQNLKPHMVCHCIHPGCNLAQRINFSGKNHGSGPCGHNPDKSRTCTKVEHALTPDDLGAILQ